MLLLNGHPLKITHFPDRTSQVWKLPNELLDAPDYWVRWEFSDESELVHLAQLKALLDLAGHKTKLEINYLPYARQDKPVSNETTFALRPFATLINSLRFDEIVILDPHSSVATTLIERARAIYPTEKVGQVAKLLSIHLLAYPDKGARDRYGAIYSSPSIYGEKVRNQSTGKIESYAVVGDPSGQKVLIVDDICDGGATFCALARELLAKGATETHLFITHGLFTQGLAPLLQAGIRRIFTARGEAIQSDNTIQYQEYRS